MAPGRDLHEIERCFRAGKDHVPKMSTLLAAGEFDLLRWLRVRQGGGATLDKPFDVDDLRALAAYPVRR